MTHAVCRAHLPERIPAPYDITGYFAPEGIDAGEFYAGWFGASLFLVVALVALVRSRGDTRSRMWVVWPGYSSALTFFLFAKAQIVAYGAPTLADVHTPLWQYLLVLSILAAYLLLLHSVAPVAPRPTRGPVPTSLLFDPGLRVLWSGRATNRVRLWSGSALLVAAAVTAAFSSSIAAALLLLAAGGLWNHGSRVRVENGTVSVSRPAGRPTREIAMGDVASARAQTIAGTMYWWGLNLLDMDAGSIVNRPGDVLVIERSDHHLPLYVSVDHADEAADVINALIARARASA